MIQKYDSDAMYEIFEIQDNGEQYKIGEIEDNTYYDLNKKGKRIPQGFNFSNNNSFWKQFTKIKIKKTIRPLGGYEPVVWGAYWTISILLTIFLISIADGIENQIFWLVTSAIHLGLTIKFRRNKIVVYWMTAISIIIVVIFLIAGSKQDH